MFVGFFFSFFLPSFSFQINISVQKTRKRDSREKEVYIELKMLSCKFRIQLHINCTVYCTLYSTCALLQRQELYGWWPCQAMLAQPPTVGQPPPMSNLPLPANDTITASPPTVLCCIGNLDYVRPVRKSPQSPQFWLTKVDYFRKRGEERLHWPSRQLCQGSRDHLHQVYQPIASDYILCIDLSDTSLKDHVIIYTSV